MPLLWSDSVYETHSICPGGLVSDMDEWITKSGYKYINIYYLLLIAKKCLLMFLCCLKKNPLAFPVFETVLSNEWNITVFQICLHVHEILDPLGKNCIPV